MANTTNYNWETPDDTDLVKDGAAAIRTLGSSVDTTTKALNPSTTLGDIEYRSATANTNTRLGIGSTGQILSVVAGVPAWVANDVGDITEVQAGTGISVASGTGPVPVITNTVATEFDAKGDLVVGTGADTFDKLTVGANNTVLTADSSTATGLKWAAAAGGGKVLQVVQGTLATTASTSSTSYTDTGLEVSITPTSASSKILIFSSVPASVTDGDNGGGFSLFRSTTNLVVPTSPSARYAGYLHLAGAQTNITFSMYDAVWNYLYEPATTSATTYKVRFIALNAARVVYVNRTGYDADFSHQPRGVATIIAMEIGA